MTQHVVDKVRIKRTVSITVFDSPLGVCRVCNGELDVELRRLLGPVPFTFKAQPRSHIIVKVSRRLTTRRLGQLTDLINDKIRYCHGNH